MKRIIAVLCLSAMLLCVLAIPGSATDSEPVGIYFMLIADSDSIAGCAESTSVFDAVIDAVIASSHRIAVFFDVNIVPDRDFASALMKAYSANMPVGIYDYSSDTAAETVENILIYQKYVTKTVSRLVLTNPASELYGNGFSVYYISGFINPNVTLLDAKNMSNFANSTFPVRIKDSLKDALIKLFGELYDSDLVFFTPTETGYAAAKIVLPDEEEE